MSIIEYKLKNAKTNREEMKSLKYWCNACGELHHHGEYDITEEELPEDLKRAYNDLWTDGSGSLCYLVEYNGKNGIALVNEYDKCFASDSNISMDKMYIFMKNKAEVYSNMQEFKDATIICGEYTGCDECHELITILPCDYSKEAFVTIADILQKTAYYLCDHEYCKELEKKSMLLKDYIRTEMTDEEMILFVGRMLTDNDICLDAVENKMEITENMIDSVKEMLDSKAEDFM